MTSTEPGFEDSGIIARNASRVVKVANASAVVGPVQTANGRSVIPLATVRAAYGFGQGMGGEGEQAGMGGGGGGGGQARPVAVLEVTDGGVRLHTVVDSTRIALASLALAAWTVFWITRTIRAFRRR
jgi:uncharacterized spore protein YtfJ